MHTSRRKARFRSREYTLALLAGVFVLASIFIYSRDGAGLSSRPVTALQNEPPYQRPPDIDPSLAEPPPSPDADADGETDGETDADADAALGPTFPPQADHTDAALGGAGHPAAVPPPTALTQASSSSSSSSSSSFLPPSSPRAVIIESALIPNLVPLMLHFATVLGPAWGVVLFTLADGWEEPRSPAFQRGLAAGRLEVRFLPAGTALASSRAVSRFLTAPWLWEQLAGAARVLLFQSDSVLCSASAAAADDYFAFDFVGAPIAAAYGAGFNGGLSLRNPRRFLEVVRAADFAGSGQEFEDQFFYEELKKRGAAMPDEDVAKTFAVETMYYETPLGYHQPQRWQVERMGQIEAWCPEVKMLMARRAN